MQALIVMKDLGREESRKTSCMCAWHPCSQPKLTDRYLGSKTSISSAWEWANLTAGITAQEKQGANFSASPEQSGVCLVGKAVIHCSVPQRGGKAYRINDDLSLVINPVQHCTTAEPFPSLTALSSHLSVAAATGFAKSVRTSPHRFPLCF